MNQPQDPRTAGRGDAGLRAHRTNPHHPRGDTTADFGDRFYPTDKITPLPTNKASQP